MRKAKKKPWRHPVPPRLPVIHIPRARKPLPGQKEFEWAKEDPEAESGLGEVRNPRVCAGLSSVETALDTTSENTLESARPPIERRSAAPTAERLNRNGSPSEAAKIGAGNAPLPKDRCKHDAS